MSKQCTLCGKEKELTEFYLRKGKPRGQCKLCIETAKKAKRQEYRAKNPAKRPGRKLGTKGTVKEYVSPETKVCTGCQNNKAIDCFYFDKDRNAHQSRCKACRSIYVTSERGRMVRNQWKTTRRQEPIFRIEESLRSRIWHAVKYNRKASNTANLVGCPLSFLIEWLSWQFTGSMTLDNYGSAWHIDHCRPCCSYDLSLVSEQYACFNWANLQPLSRTANLTKGSSRQLFAEVMQELKMRTFLNLMKIHSLTSGRKPMIVFTEL